MILPGFSKLLFRAALSCSNLWFLDGRTGRVAGRRITVCDDFVDEFEYQLHQRVNKGFIPLVNRTGLILPGAPLNTLGTA